MREHCFRSPVNPACTAFAYLSTLLVLVPDGVTDTIVVCFCLSLIYVSWYCTLKTPISVHFKGTWGEWKRQAPRAIMTVALQIFQYPAFNMLRVDSDYLTRSVHGPRTVPRRRVVMMWTSPSMRRSSILHWLWSPVFFTSCLPLITPHSLKNITHCCSPATASLPYLLYLLPQYLFVYIGIALCASVALLTPILHLE